MRRDLKAACAAKVEHAVRVDQDMVALANATPAQIDAWVDANVTTIAQVRRVLKLLLKVAMYSLRGRL